MSTAIDIQPPWWCNGTGCDWFFDGQRLQFSLGHNSTFAISAPRGAKGVQRKDGIWHWVLEE